MPSRRAVLGAAAAAAALGGLVSCASVRDPAQPLRRIALASCIDQTKPQPIWDAVLASRPDLLLFAGDNVYASEQPWSLARLEAAYALQAAVPDFARLREQVPHMAVWDDHDYGLNDGGAEFPHKQASKEAFMRFWRLPPDDPRRGREGLYHAQVFGPPGQRVQVIVLDTRWFRSPLKPTDARNQPGRERYLPDADPGKTMLGAAQWQWLERQLRQPAELRLVVSSVQAFVRGHGWEGWHTLPLEQQRLARLIASTGAGGVLLLSGDRHIGAIYREDAAGTPYPLWELTSSGVTHTWQDAAEAGPNRVGSLVTALHTGAVEIDWAARRLTLALHGADGRTLHSQGIDFDTLQIKARTP